MPPSPQTPKQVAALRVKLIPSWSSRTLTGSCNKRRKKMVKECLDNHVLPWECKILRRSALSVIATIVPYCKEESVGCRGKRVVKIFKDSNTYLGTCNIPKLDCNPKRYRRKKKTVTTKTVTSRK